MSTICKIVALVLALTGLASSLSKAKVYSAAQVYTFLESQKLFTSTSSRKMKLEPGPMHVFEVQKLSKIAGKPVEILRWLGAVQQVQASYYFLEGKKEVAVDLEIVSYENEAVARAGLKQFEALKKSNAGSVEYSILKVKSNLIVSFDYLFNKPSQTELSTVSRLLDQL